MERYIYKDQNWLIVEKPSGISTHNSRVGDLGLAEWLVLHHGEQVYVCSRLDKDTSGLLLFARQQQLVAEAERVHEEGRAKKTYYFVATKSAKGTWVCDSPLDGKACQTVFERVEVGSHYCLYTAVITRGRTHQIRRHAAAAGIPLLGDTKYGGDSFCRVCLHCAEIDWPGIEGAVTSSIPDWFVMSLDGSRPEHTALALAEKRYPFLESVTNCCRLIHRGEYPAEDVAIDKYGDWLCVTGFTEGQSAKAVRHRLDKVLSAFTTRCNIRGGVVKTNLRNPHNRKLFGDFACFGEVVPESYLVNEHGLQFEVQLNDTQHVGLFLDHRDSRRRIGQAVKGKRVANLFAFTCSFSIYALAGEAEVVFSVDLASGCLTQGKKNVTINQLGTGSNAKFIQEDVRKWLARQLRKKEREQEQYPLFDCIICDPPVFAAGGKGKKFFVEKEWQGLAHSVASLLAPRGIALFSNNHQAGSESFYHDCLCKAFSQVTCLTPAMDFPKIAGRSSHLRIYWCLK